MKKSFKTWWNYVIIAGLLLIISLVAFIPYVCNAPGWSLNVVYMVYIFSGILVIFIGFVIQDIYRARIRHKTKNWDQKLPEKNLNFAWAFLMPSLLSGAISILTGGIISIIIA